MIEVGKRGNCDRGIADGWATGLSLVFFMLMIFLSPLLYDLLAWLQGVLVG